MKTLIVFFPILNFAFMQAQANCEEISQDLLYTVKVDDNYTKLSNDLEISFEAFV